MTEHNKREHPMNLMTTIANALLNIATFLAYVTVGFILTAFVLFVISEFQAHADAASISEETD